MTGLGSSYHFVGIGGAGMSAIARVLLARGVSVSGSDLVSTPSLERLRRQGATVAIGHRSDNVGPVDAVVVSSAIPADNVEVNRAHELGVPVIQRMDLLGLIMDHGSGIAVAGTHGKTTTTSLVALVLDDAGLDPTVLVGGELNDIGGNARHGDGRYVVAEVDESDGTFVRLSPHAAVVTNVEDDHLDHYTSLDGVKHAFARFVDRVDPDGFVVVCTDDLFLAELAERAPCRVITYGFADRADLVATDVRFERGVTSYRLRWNGTDVHGTMRVPGRHNVANALGAAGVAVGLGLSVSDACRAMGRFRGVGRRFETIASDPVWIVDDYAHHPTEVAATVTAAREVWPGRIVVVFQPHRYSRTRLLASRFARSMQGADLVLITDIYGAGETPDPKVTGELVAREASGSVPAQYVGDLDGAVAELVRLVRPGDLVLTVGAGNVRTVGVRLAGVLRPGKGADR